MNIKNTFNVREQLALRLMMTKLEPLTKDLSPDELSQLQESLWQCFIDADQEWEKDFIPSIMPGNAGTEFLETITRMPN